MSNQEQNLPVVEANGTSFVKGKSFTETDKFWIATANKVTSGAVDAVEEGAKQIITTASLLQGIYFAGVSLSDVKGIVSLDSLWSCSLILLILTPAIMWSISCVFAIRVFSPKMYKTNFDSPDLCRMRYLDMVNDKLYHLRTAQWILVLGFIPFIVDIFIYLVFLPSAPT